MTSKQRNNVLVLLDGEWTLRDKDDVSDEMIQKSWDTLHSHFESNRGRLKKEMSDCLFHDVVTYLNNVAANNLDIRIKLKEKVDEIIEMITRVNGKT